MNNYNLSIIIAHYCTDKNKEHYKSFLKTLDIIQKQTNNNNIEIIISDDGSEYSKNILNDYSEVINIPNDTRKLFFLEETDLKNHLKLHGINNNFITKWLYIPKSKPCMSKARLWNYSTNFSKSNYLLFLDDDNYFISQNSIDNILELFSKYDTIFGHIKDNNNRLRKYSSSRVQGTTIGIKKSIIKKIGGFGEWTEKVSCGIDSDLWIKLFNHHKQNPDSKACYTNLISTYDSCSKRWKKYTKIFKDLKVKKEFLIHHGIKLYKNPKYNQSRQKNLWIKNLLDE